LIDDVLAFAWANERGNSHERSVGSSPRQGIPEEFTLTRY
jgi:hypothetical protein